MQYRPPILIYTIYTQVLVYIPSPYKLKLFKPYKNPKIPLKMVILYLYINVIRHYKLLYSILRSTIRMSIYISYIYNNIYTL